MHLLNPKRETFTQFDSPTREIMLKTIDFFERKGKKNLKHEDHERIWYDDFIEFQKKEKVFYTFLTPAKYGDSDCKWESARNTAYSEILGFYSLSHWYVWQVSILGLGPLWIGQNEELKIKTARLLKEGGIFGFGLSEKEHGADLIATDMLLIPNKDGTYTARGDKYYIGNGNKGALISVFGKISDSKEYVFFAVETNHPKYECLGNVVNSQKYVAEFFLHDYPITEKEIISRGRAAWDTSLATVAFAKFNLGMAAIGIATHSMYEAINHASARRLYSEYVTDFPHIRQLFLEAYARLTAMRLFAYRAKDYVKVASSEDRRYLLYNPMVKMKVTMQGEEVINLIWDVIAAKGFEKDTYFESATRDIRMLPKLEGTVHVNMILVIKFMMNYLFETGDVKEIPKSVSGENDDFLFVQGATTKGLDLVRFGDYRKIYEKISLPNISIFRKQIDAFKELLIEFPPSKDQSKDLDFMLSIGEIFTLIAYGQLIIENAIIEKLNEDVIGEIFDFMIRDLSKYALNIHLKASTTAEQMKICMKMVQKPESDKGRSQRVWTNSVYSLKDSYKMND